VLALVHVHGGGVRGESRPDVVTGLRVRHSR
jgi:hypothetical protein